MLYDFEVHSIKYWVDFIYILSIGVRLEQGRKYHDLVKMSKFKGNEKYLWGWFIRICLREWMLLRCDVELSIE